MALGRANGGTPGSGIPSLSLSHRLVEALDLDVVLPCISFQPSLSRAHSLVSFFAQICCCCKSVWICIRLLFGLRQCRSVAMSSSDRGGIQALLAAEQDAQHIVANARAAKTARLRQAKDEAEREVAQYRAQREAEFRKKLSDTSGDSGANVKRLEAETDEKIKRLSAEAAKVAPEVTALLMKYVITVRN